MIPGETSLAQTFGVSRMTVNRALRELTAEQILTRVQGSGTFVAQQKYQATLVAIRNIAEEIVAARGHQHSAGCTGSSACAHRRDVRAVRRAAGRTLFTLIVHFERRAVADSSIVARTSSDRLRYAKGGRPWVNANWRPTTWSRISRRPRQCLPDAGRPAAGVEYRIEARQPPREIAEMLHMDVREPG